MHFQTRPRCSNGIMYHVSYWFPLLVLCYLFPLSLSLSSSPHICMPMCDSSHRIPTQSLGVFQIIINTLTAPRRLNSNCASPFISYCDQRDDHEGNRPVFSRDYSACFKNMLKPDEDRSFFNRERDRLAGEIATGFEELLSSSNILNRKLEEVLGMTREYDTIAGLWGRFHELMKGQKDAVSLEEQPLGLPGTGGHVVSSSKQGGGGK